MIMQIVCTNNNGTKYLQVLESHYEISSDGKARQKKRVVKNLGPLARFDDGQPDFLARLRASFRDGHPMLRELDELAERMPAPRIRLELDPGSLNDCTCDPKNIGYFLLDALYDALGIYDVLNFQKSHLKIGYDLNGLVKLLVFGRVLRPGSKISAFEGRERYLFAVTQSGEPREIYRALDCLNEKSDAIQKRMNTKISAAVGRNTEVCFYDVTNYYFEIGQNDEDEKDGDGGVVRHGLRKKGVSKEKRSEPIVQMGLFIDDNGLPIAYRLFPGNSTDQTTLRPALEKSIDKMGFGKVIIVADGGLNNGPNIAHILSKGNGYIVSKSTKKSDKNVKKWILDGDGYVWNEKRTFKVKHMTRQRKIEDADGKRVNITEKLVCYWSKKHYDREVKENAKFIGYLESVIKNPDKLKDRPRKIEKFLKKTELKSNWYQ
jgi:hypothetical protein